LSSQMQPARFETTTFEIDAGPYGVRASSSKLTFPGFLAVYKEDSDDEENGEGLPGTKPGEPLTLSETDDDSHAHDLLLVRQGEGARYGSPRRSTVTFPDCMTNAPMCNASFALATRSDSSNASKYSSTAGSRTSRCKASTSAFVAASRSCPLLLFVEESITGPVSLGHRNPAKCS